MTLKREPLAAELLDFSIPIVVLTAMAVGEWKAKALKAGAAEYLLKPISPHALMNVVRKLIEQPSLFER